jgi:outer membrane biosynthesis protein TonB
MASQDEQALRAQLGRARERLDGLVRDLHVIDMELEGLSTERQQYRLVQDACAALERLRGMGAAALFWGERTAVDSDEQLRLARGRVDAFQKGLDEIESRRCERLEEIEHAQEDVEILEDDVFQLELEAEQRKREWIVERDVAALPVSRAVMPWARGGEDDDRFRKSLAAALLLSLLLGVVFPLIDLPLPERWEVLEVPDRLTRLIREERPLPPPPTPQETRPAEQEPSEEAPQLAKESTPEAAPKQSPTPKPESKGILAFREKFSGLAAQERPTRLGSQARIKELGDSAIGRPTRSMVTTMAPGSSGGINLASLSRDVGNGDGTQIEGVQVARATSAIGTGGGSSDRPLSDGPGLSRTDEEIQIVFDRHKSALYRLYNRDLRRDPTLKGQMVLRIRIEPDGSVSLCEVQSTDMKAPQLAAQVAERVRTFDFGAKEGIAAVTILYPIDFLPAI